MRCSGQSVSAVHDLVVMGGNEAYNEWTSTGAEFNFYCDPDAADVVMQKVCKRKAVKCAECFWDFKACAQMGMQKQMHMLRAHAMICCSWMRHALHVTD